MAFNSSNDNIRDKASELSERTGLTIDLQNYTVSSPQVQSTAQNVLSAKDFVASICEQSKLAELLPVDMTIREFSEMNADKILQFSSSNMDIFANLPFCIEVAKQHVQQCDSFHSASLPCPIPHASPSHHLSAQLSPRNSSLGSQQSHESVGIVPSNNHSSAGSQMLAASANPQSARFNPLTRIFLRRTFSENTRRARAPSCNLGASAGSALLKSVGLGQPTRSPGLPHCSFGHELSNLVRLGSAAFGQSAPCLLTAREAEANSREFLSSSTHHVGGRLRSSTSARRSSHASGGPLGSARNDSTASTATSPTESPKPFGQSGHFLAGFSRCSNGHRRWSVASLPGSSGYATEPGGVGSDGASSIYTSNEGLPASPGLNPPQSLTAPLTQDSVNAIRQRHHALSLGAPTSLSLSVTGGVANAGSNNNNSSSLLSPRASGTSAFSSSDSNPVFEIQTGQVGAPPELVSPIPQRPRLTRKHSTPSLCSLADDDVAILNSVYQECFPRAQRIMEDRLRSLIATEQANPIALPESMDGAFCFVHDQALQLAADCLRASELNQLSAAQFANLSSNLGQLAKQAKQKCPLSAQKLHRIIINILMAIARCARLCECLEFCPDSLKLDNQLDTPGQGIISQVQGDVYRYVTEQLGDLVPAGLGGLDDVSFFNTSIRRQNTTTLQTPHQTPAISQPPQQQRMSTSVGPIVAPCEEDFEVLKNISNGAYGAVFLVRQKRTGQRFAMKRINKRCLALHNQCEQIWAERNILTFADNPFVVQMYCSFETPRHFCMVMEYVQGGDVGSLLKKVRTIPVDLARVYFAEIVLALAYLHSYGIIHRDIKPDNLLITATGHIKLTDFGLSKIGLMNRTTHLYESAGSGCGTSTNSERLFKDKQVYGTPQYIAPEVILGQDYGKAVDWWSVGVVLYECLLGVTPFYGQTPQEVFHMIVYHDAIEWPDDPDDPLYPTDDSRDIVESLLQNDPELRLGSGPGDATDVKGHAFFDSVDWTAVLWQKAEMLFVPQLDDEDDTGYFDSRTDRYSHDDTAADNEAMMQAIDMVFPPAGSCSPYEGNSPLIRSRVGSVVSKDEGPPSSITSVTLMPPSCDATLAAATTPPMSDLMFHSFCSFSPRYARDSLSLISSSGESSPSLLTQSLSAADLNSARHVINSSSSGHQNESPAEESVATTTTTNTNQTTSGESTAAAVSLTSIVSDSLGVATTGSDSSATTTSTSRPVPVISVNATAATPPNSKPDSGSNILSLAAAQVAASQQKHQQEQHNRRVRHAAPTSAHHQHQSKPLSLLIPTSSSSNAASHTQSHQTLGHSSSSPLSGPEDRRISAGSEESSSSLSPLSPGGFAVPPPVCPNSVIIKRGPHGFGFTFRTVRIREPAPVLTPGLKTPNRQMKSRLQHQILSVQTNSPAAAAGLQPGHVIMAINDGSVDGHSHIDVLTRLVASKHEVTVYTCDPDSAVVMRQTPAAAVSAISARAARKVQMSISRGSSMAAAGPTATPASTMAHHRKPFDPAAKSRSNLCRHASMSEHSGIHHHQQQQQEALSPTESTTSTTSETTPQQVPQMRLSASMSRPSSSSGSSRPSLTGSHTKLAASFSGSGGSVRMQRALSQTMLPMSVQAVTMRRAPSTSSSTTTTTPCRPQQLLTLPATTAGGGGHYGSSNLLSSSLPQGALSHALSSASSVAGGAGGGGGAPATKPRNMRQLSHQQGGQSSAASSSLHPSKADGGSSSVSRRRSFHTMPSPLARTPSPLTAGSSPTTGNNNNASSLLASSGGSSGQVNVTASLPITPISPQRACSPLVQEPGGSLRTRNISNRRVQSVYVPHYTVNNNSGGNGAVGAGNNNNGSGSSNNAFPSESSSSSSLPVDYCSDSGVTPSGAGDSNNKGIDEDHVEIVPTERKSESAVVTPVQSAQPVVRRRLTTDDGTWPDSSHAEEQED